MNQAVIAFGSNISPAQNIQKAKKHLSAHADILNESRITQTKPIGIQDQPDFLNGSWLIETGLSQKILNQHLKKIEDSLGRDRTAKKFGPRTIDLDIIVWNNAIVDPDVFTRDFLKAEIAELLPDLKFE